MKKKVSLVLVLIIMVLSMCFSLVACGDTTETYGDIYKQASSIPEYTSAELYCKVPKDWKIDTETDEHSDTGYIPSINAFIIKSKENTKRRDILFVGSNTPMFSDKGAISQIRIVGELAALKNGNDFYVYDLSKKKIVISKEKFNDVAILRDNPNIDDVIKILDQSLVAINPKYDIENKDKAHTLYTSIYRPTYTDEITDRGVLVARIKNIKGGLKNLKGFEGRYVSLENDSYTESDNAETIRIFNVISHGKEYENDGDKIIRRKADTKKQNITYIGSGRFYCFMNWTTSGDDYTMELKDTKYKVERYIFNAEVGKSYPVNSNIVVEELTNKYYGPEKIGLVASRDFLNGNRMYAPIAYSLNDKKEATYDQFILDSEMNIELSLSGNFGRKVSVPTDGKISIYELILDYVDGYGYAPIKADVLNIYDTNGNFVYQYKDKPETINIPVETASLNNGMLIVEKKINNRLVSSLVEVATGEIKAGFEYEFIVPFTGEQTIAKTQDGRLVVIGKSGEEVKEKDMIKDIASSSTNSALYKCKEMFTVGCYIAQETVNNVKKFAVRNFRTNKEESFIIPFTQAPSCTLYPYDARTTFVMFERPVTDADFGYEVYRLI